MSCRPRQFHRKKTFASATRQRNKRRVKPFENADEPVTRFLTEAESTRLVNACVPDFRPLVKAALYTGCRYGEMTRLLTKDVNLDTGLIYISHEAKSGKGRHIPLHTEGLDFFKTCILGKTGKDHVFLRGDGAPWGKNHHVRLLKAACAQAKTNRRSASTNCATPTPAPWPSWVWTCSPSPNCWATPIPASPAGTTPTCVTTP